MRWLPLLLLLLSMPLQAGVVNTRHNLSVSGPGTIRAQSETEVCIFCHTPHGAYPQAPLWNRYDSGSQYIPYSSSSIEFVPGQPNGSSLLCLSCHDGTIALGKIRSRTTEIVMSGGVTVMPAGRTLIGTDLGDDHPISFVYSSSLAGSDGELANPSTLTGPVRLDAAGRVQCTSCHDPHDDSNGNFLVMSNIRGTLCNTCHQKRGWGSASHATSGATWNGAGNDPWPDTDWNNVRDNACQNCHQPHGAGAGGRLLRYAAEEENCLDCHNGNVAAHDIGSVLMKSYSHPVSDFQGTHEPGETAVVNSRHVECQDCHNPHAARSGSGDPPGALAEVRGVSISGGEVDPLTREYQLCLRCHGDSAGKPPPYTTRLHQETNVRLEFDTGNPSYHPVAGVGNNPNVPSLKAPWTTSSIIRCTDCHNNDDQAGPRGPHGSSYRPILERQYLTSDPTPESEAAYALCYKCHDRNSILGNQSFSRHSFHIGGGRMRKLNTPCNVCHDPHGVQTYGGRPERSEKLINFDTSVVQPNSSGLLYYESRGTFAGACYLSCHGKNHNPCTYGTGGGMGCGGGGGGGGGGMGP
ncbi:MAG TPA: hypothetical protein ENK54_09465 [Thiotrichales bacterium]|nr:hypothetical protein [Thiotrichales bacterium]